MENPNNNKSSLSTVDTNIKSSHSIRFYFNLIVRNKIPILLCLFVGLIVSYFYAYSQVDIYSSASSLRLSKPKENVLEGKLFSDIEGDLPERYISNEVEILRSFAIREKTARSLIDSFKVLQGKLNFILVCENQQNCTNPKSVNAVSNLLQSNIEISQKRGLDIVLIKAESPSPQEAALIANCYAEAYADYSLKYNRTHLTLNREFLEKQMDEKYNELLKSEDNLTSFLRSENIVELNSQAGALINSMSNVEAQYNDALISVQASNKSLNDYRNELSKYDPQASDYFESKVTDPYIGELQQEIAKLEIQRDLVKSGNEPLLKDSRSLKELELKIAELKNNLDEKINILKKNATSN
ncbi:MAG: GumC family protein, partial [Ignavibacteria bacterium]